METFQIENLDNKFGENLVDAQVVDEVEEDGNYLGREKTIEAISSHGRTNSKNTKAPNLDDCVEVEREENFDAFDLHILHPVLW